MSEDDDVPDHPDWFDAEGAANGHPPADEFDPEGADWFDDLTRLDPTPGDTPARTGSEGASEDGDTAAAASEDGGTAAAAGATTSDPPAGPGTTADTTGGSTVETGGGADGDGTTAARDRSGTSDDRGGRVYRDEQGRQVRQPAEPDPDDSGGIIAWLKRLLGLN